MLDGYGDQYMCITGAAAGRDGVCAEHGETACVIEVLCFDLLTMTATSRPRDVA